MAGGREVVSRNLELGIRVDTLTYLEKALNLNLIPNYQLQPAFQFSQPILPIAAFRLQALFSQRMFVSERRQYPKKTKSKSNI